MLTKIKPESLHTSVRVDVQRVRKSLQLFTQLSEELASLSGSFSKSTKSSHLSERYQSAKMEIRDKLRSIGCNLDQMASLFDRKLQLIAEEIAKIEGAQNNKKLETVEALKKVQQEHQYKISQLQERIFELQKRENQNVQEISELKESNAKLREEFNSLSFGSNQRIKELSEKLHNNTSPNLGIKRQVSANNPQISCQGSDELKLRKRNSNFVKIKGTPSEPKVEVEGRANTKNMLDSLSSESSQQDLSQLGMDYQQSIYEQNSGNLKFGCFVGKPPVSEKTKTGSSNDNKSKELDDKNDKNRRFEFLLNNLRESNPNSDQEPVESFFNKKAYSGEREKQEHSEHSSPIANKGYTKNSFFNNEDVKRFQI